MRSFTAEELERATGFDRRTIAYYVQEGLIPRVGRRGPRTRYPKLVMDRLLFIRRVREAEEAGELGPVSLSEMRTLFERLPPELIAQVAARKLPAVVAVEPVNRSTDTERESMEETGITREASEPTVSSSPKVKKQARQGELKEETLEESCPQFSMAVGMSKDLDALEILNAVFALDDKEADLGEALSELQTRARGRRRREPGILDRWSRVEISPDIALSVRGVTDEDAPLLEAVGKKLRRLIAGPRYRRKP